MRTNDYASSRKICPKSRQAARDFTEIVFTYRSHLIKLFYLEEKSMLLRVLAAFACLLAMTYPAKANLHFHATLNGAQEVPAVASPGIGSFAAEHDVTGTLTVSILFSGLTSNVTGAQFHCCADSVGTEAGAAIDLVPAGFPVGVNAGAFDFVFEMNNPDTYDPAYLVDSGGAVIDAHFRFVQSMERNFVLPERGIAYVDIQTSMHPDGEIRGNIDLDRVVPEPTAMVLFVSGIAALCAANRRRR
jgi:hypothetical protein